MMTDKSLHEQDERLRLTAFAHAHQQFRARWQPETAHDREEFERQLHYLIGLAYREAQVPLIAQLTAMVALPLPLHPLLVKP